MCIFNLPPPSVTDRQALRLSKSIKTTRLPVLFYKNGYLFHNNHLYVGIIASTRLHSTNCPYYKLTVTSYTLKKNSYSC